MTLNNGSDNVAEAARTASPKPKSASHKSVKKRQHEASSVSFPYMDQDTGVSVALGIIGAGGVALTREQLAGVMSSSAGSGTFLVKIATARIFGLIAFIQGKYELTNLGFSILDSSDEKRQRKARAESFLNVALYRRVYDEFKGKQLPPRPHGLEQAFVRFGVAQKQASNARLAFDKSAKQAGFFAAGSDRLIEPIIGAVSPADRNRAEENEVNGDKGRLATESSQPKIGGHHPFIQGLLDTLPVPNTNWTIEGRAKWLQAAAHCFDLIYNGSGEITITAKNEPQTK